MQRFEREPSVRGTGLRQGESDELYLRKRPGREPVLGDGSPEHLFEKWRFECPIMTQDDRMFKIGAQDRVDPGGAEISFAVEDTISCQFFRQDMQFVAGEQHADEKSRSPAD